tara:strand:- start:19258 stop:19554 length:297 start_codon:yes stop_codon:yes gene_type:complete
MSAKTSKIRRSAKGEDCTLRLGNCSSSETVVLAHIGKDKGVGIKCADYMAVYACYSCHDIIDSRAKSSFTYDELNTEKLRALEETLGILINKGLLNVI